MIEWFERLDGVNTLLFVSLNCINEWWTGLCFKVDMVNIENSLKIYEYIMEYKL